MSLFTFEIISPRNWLRRYHLRFFLLRPPNFVLPRTPLEIVMRLFVCVCVCACSCMCVCVPRGFYTVYTLLPSNTIIRITSPVCSLLHLLVPVPLGLLESRKGGRAPPWIFDFSTTRRPPGQTVPRRPLPVAFQSFFWKITTLLTSTPRPFRGSPVVCTRRSRGTGLSMGESLHWRGSTIFCAGNRVATTFLAFL